MKIRILFAGLFVSFCSILMAQQTWQHTNGPEGGSYFSIAHNDRYAWCHGSNFLYRTSDGVQWTDKVDQVSLWPVSILGDTLVAQQQLIRINPGLLRFVVSFDGGLTWEERQRPSPHLSITSLAACSHGVYAGLAYTDAIYKTQDWGQTWDSIAAPGPYLYGIWGADDRLFAFQGGQLHRLLPNGVDWEVILPQNLMKQSYVNGVFAEDSLLFVSTDKSLFASVNYGQSWSKTNMDYNNAFSHFVRTGNRVYKAPAPDGMVYTEDFGKTWKPSPLKEDYLIQELGLGVLNGQLLVSTYNKGLFSIDTANHQMVQVNSGLAESRIFYMDSDSTSLWTACPAGVFAYDVVSDTWVDKALLPVPERHFGYMQVEVSPQGKIATFSENARHFYLSVDGGDSWNALMPFDTNKTPGSTQITYLQWLGERLLVTSPWAGSVISDDYGASWTPIQPKLDNIQFLNGKYYGLSESDNYLFVSTDQGKSWQVDAVQPPTSRVALYATADRLFIFGNDAVLGRTALYASTDGSSWQLANDGLPSILIFPVPYRSVQPGGIWKKGGDYYFSVPDMGFFISKDSCQTWLPISQSWVVPFGDTILFRASAGLLRSGYPDYYGAISRGTVFLDENNNGLQEPDEPPLPNVSVAVKKPGAWYPYWFVNTQSDGSYVIGNTPGGEDTLEVGIQSKYLEQVNPEYHLIDSSAADRNFGVHFTPDVTDASVRVGHGGRPRPGFDLKLYLSYKNEGTLPVSGKVSVKLDPAYRYQGAVPAPSEQIGADSLVWAFSDLPVFEAASIRILGTVDSATQLGSAFSTRGYVWTSPADFDPMDNLFVRTDTVVGSFDPNEKRVEPENGIRPEEILAGRELFYTVHFQNTGTYQADRVRITDQLDTSLAPQTLRMVDASHTVTSFRLLPGNLLEVVFDQIALPDSNSNEPASHGFVTFAVQRKKQYRLNHQIPNRAAIYFDFNEPIITNTVYTPIIQQPVSVVAPTVPSGGKAQLRISPNPGTGLFKVSSEKALSGKGLLYVWDAVGRLRLVIPVTDASAWVTLDGSALEAGIYYLGMTGKEGAASGVLVVGN